MGFVVSTSRLLHAVESQQIISALLACFDCRPPPLAGIILSVATYHRTVFRISLLILAVQYGSWQHLYFICSSDLRMPFAPV